MHDIDARALAVAGVVVVCPKDVRASECLFRKDVPTAGTAENE
jgi:hypothetical protein